MNLIFEINLNLYECMKKFVDGRNARNILYILYVSYFYVE